MLAQFSFLFALNCLLLATGSSSSLKRLPLWKNKYNNVAAEIGLGTPAQTFIVLLDTGSTDLWVPSSKWQQSDPVHRQRNQYNESLSSSYSEYGSKVEFQYADGSAMAGTLVNDDLQLAGMVVKQQTFAAMTSIMYSMRMICDGILGLSIETNSQTKVNFSSPLQNMFNQGLIQAPVVSFQFKKGPGELIFGVDLDLVDGNVIYSDYNNKGRIYLDKVSLRYQGADSDVLLSKTILETTIDTGTAVIFGPKSEVDALNAHLGEGILVRGKYLVLNCDLSKLPKLVFTVKGKEFILDPEDYLWLDEWDGGHNCWSDVVVSDTPLWSLGLRFLEKFYTIFDHQSNRIGLSDLKLS